MAAEVTSQPETFLFNDDGRIPNSTLPLLLYRRVFTSSADPASWLEDRFVANHWRGTWRNGVYPFHHYHSTSHEVLGVYSGSATLQLGGEEGKVLTVNVGDVIVIPAGVGHKKLTSSPDFGLVGAYPDGRQWDVLRGEPGERPEADHRIALLPLPDTDPIYGAQGPLRQHWQSVTDR